MFKKWWFFPMLALIGGSIFSWHGLLALPIWGYVLLAFVLTHMTLATVTIYLHRGKSHGALEFSRPLDLAFRFWNWLTTAMSVKDWSSLHRKHHAKNESPEDPHSPSQKGLARILFDGAEVYRLEVVKYNEGVKSGTEIDRTRDIPEHWFDRNATFGVVLMLAIDASLFGSAGLILWSVQMACIPFLAAGVINGVAHTFGYRNFEQKTNQGYVDRSANISPIGIFICGEELHGNHHTFETSAKFSVMPYEFDLGWVYIKALSGLGLLRVKRAVYRASGTVSNALRARNGKTYECIKI